MIHTGRLTYTLKNKKMIKKKPSRPIEIDLTGPDGNAFALMGNAKRWSRDLGLDWDVISKELTSGDYEHLVSVMDKYFGSVVVFYK